MPPVLRFSRYRDIAAEVAERLAAGREGRDPFAPWPHEVIVPSSGVRDAISAELLQRFPHGVAGLRFHYLEELALRLVNAAGEFPHIARDPERRLAMRTAIRTIDHPMMEGRGLAAMLERSYRDVRDGGVTLAELATRVRTARGLRNADRTRTILRAWTEYERLIALLGAADGADVLTRAMHFASGARPQLLAGFYDMTGVQRKFVEALLAADKIEAIWMPSDAPFAQPLARAFEKRGARRAEGRSDDESLPPSALRALPSVHEELRAVCAEAAALLTEGRKSIGIVARSLEPYDARLIERFANEHGFTTTLDAGVPLTAHRIGRGAVTLLRLRERGFLRAEVLELVRDGLRVRTKLDVDAVDAATRRARVAGGTSEELQPFRNRNNRALDDYLALVEELEQITIDLDLLGRLSSMFRIDTEEDVRAAEELEKIAMLFRRVAVWNRGFDVAPVVDTIEQVELVSNKRGDVWAGEMLRFRGRAFDHLFVVRMQDDVFPQRRNEDPLLPDADRRILGLREIGDGADEEQLLLQLLYDGATSKVHFSYAAGDGFGKVLRPSRYLRGLECGSSTAAFESGGRAAALRNLQLLAKAGTRSVFDGYLSITPDVASVSPTQLEDFGECPQKFLLKHILGVEDLEHPERELQINHREKGTLDHRILERFYRAMSDDDFQRATASLPMLPHDLLHRLDALIDESFDEHAREVPPYNRTVRAMERRATKRILREFLAADLADLEQQSLVPRHFEYRFGRKHRELADHPEPFVVDAAGVPVRIEGTIDRIDAGIGRYRIVDYKSGKALRHSGLSDKIDRGVRLQLALYAMAVAEFFHVDAVNISGMIKPLVVEGFKPQKYEFALGEKRDALLETLHIFMTSILKGVFPAFPNEGDFDSCKYCPVNHSCRTRHDAEEQYALQQEKDPRTLLSR